MSEKRKHQVPRDVEIVESSYQSSKAELEADARIKGVSFKQAIKTLVRPVQIWRVKATRHR